MTTPQTGGANWYRGVTPGPQHTHNLTPPVTTVPILPPETAIGSGAQATAWADAILAALGAPANAANIASMISWFEHEDNAEPWGAHADGAAQNNPLNVTAASGSFPGVIGSEPSGAGPGHPGNLDFDTPAHGISATVTVISGGYRAIAAALKSGTGLIGNPSVSANLSEWSGGGYNSL